MSDVNVEKLEERVERVEQELVKLKAETEKNESKFSQKLLELQLKMNNR